MRTWNIGLCPECGGDYLRLAPYGGGPPTVTHNGDGITVRFYCKVCQVDLALGVRTVRDRTEFAWMWPNGSPVLDEDGRKPVPAFLVEESKR